MNERALTPDELHARTERAVLAALGAGRTLGLHIEEPKVLHDAFSVVVELAPSPVVARVQVIVPHRLDASAQASRQRRELSVVSWLSERGHPVVPPSPLVPKEPVPRDGFSMTFWELMQLDTSAPPDYLADAPLAADLHAALRDYPADLPFLGPLPLIVPDGLAFLAENPGLVSPEHLERARCEWAVLGPVLGSRAAFTARFPEVSVQPIHGDAPSYNLMRTSAGVKYADFEDVTLGPLEWDLALFGADAADRYDARAAQVGTRALDREVLRVMDTARMLQLVASFSLSPQLPMLAEAMTPMLGQWEAMPFAGGLA
ncbi:MAG TPA: phosphotransferase [Polyangiaceae bacterium]|nr:phosphotransferase [Polyangiaceae bacterium]